MNIGLIGLTGEHKAAKYLKKQGLRILKTRFRTRHGEIDLIAMDGDMLVFAEVKYRPDGQMGDGFAAIDKKKKQHLRYAASCYLSSHPAAQYRFDAVEITSAGIRHLKNAF